MKLVKLNKRQMPKTVFSAAYNKQHRDDFDRELFQLNYTWKFFDVMRTQVFSVSVPLIGGVQYVNIAPSQAFSDRLAEQNDLFLESSWLQVMVGQGITPRDYHGLVNSMTDEKLESMLSNLLKIKQEPLSQLPSHDQYIMGMVNNANKRFPM